MESSVWIDSLGFGKENMVLICAICIIRCIQGFIHRWPGFICDPALLDGTTIMHKTGSLAVLTAYTVYLYKKNYLLLAIPKEIKPYSDVVHRSKCIVQIVPNSERLFLEQAIVAADFEMTLNVENRKLWEGWKQIESVPLSVHSVVTPGPKGSLSPANDVSGSASVSAGNSVSDLSTAVVTPDRNEESLIETGAISTSSNSGAAIATETLSATPNDEDAQWDKAFS